jgi:hypothetical protein
LISPDVCASEYDGKDPMKDIFKFDNNGKGFIATNTFSNGEVAQITSGLMIFTGTVTLTFFLMGGRVRGDTNEYTFFERVCVQM